MKEITIVRRRSPVLPVLLALLVVALLVLAGLWMLGMLPGVAQAPFGVLRDATWDTGFYQARLSFLTGMTV
jgi:hypothetical protein